MNKKIIVFGVILVILIVSGIFLLLDNPNGYAVSDDEPIKIGIILPLSGSTAFYGEASQRGIEVARKEIEEGYSGLDLEVYYEDSFYTPKGGVDAYRSLMNIYGIDGVITGASQVSLAIQPLSTEDNILQMAIFSSALKYSSANDLSFRVTTRNELEANKIGEFISEMNFERVGIFYMNNDFGVSFKDSLRGSLMNSEVEVVGEEAFMTDAVDFRTSLSKMKEADVIFMVGTAKNYGLIMKQARELDLDIQFLAMHSAEHPALIKDYADVGDGLIYTYPFDAKSDKAKEFTNAFKERYGVIPNSYAVEGYEGFKLVALGFNECGKDYVCIQNYLEDLEDYDSLFGDLRFDSNGDVYYEHFLKIFKDGEFVKYD